MKKSDAIELVINTFHKGLTTKEIVNSKMDEFVAMDIIDALEVAGMLPPFNPLSKTDYYVPKHCWEDAVGEETVP